MVRLKNTTGFRNVDDMISPVNNAGNYIGMQNNRPTLITASEVRKSLNTQYTMKGCLNQCQKGFIEPKGLIVEKKTFTINPITVDEITLKEPLTKSIEGLFEKGNNKGCKDNSYTTWNQPVMSSVENDLGICHQTLGTNVQPAYMAMNGIFNDANDGWKSSTEISQWTFEGKIPFIVHSIIFTNTTDEFKTRLLSVNTSNKTLFKEYYVNIDNIGKSYISINDNLRDESNILNIKTLKSFYNKGVGFNEIVINAYTKYVQQNDTYKLFLIEDEDGNVDALLSSYDKPELPEGFIKYAFVKSITTVYDKIELTPVFGDTLIFHTESYPFVITNDVGDISTIYNVNPLIVDWYDNVPTNYYITVDENGNTKASKTKPDEIIIAEIICYKGYITSIDQYPCNYNGLYRYNERTLVNIETAVYQNHSYTIPHNIEGIKSVECVLKCLRANNGYEIGTILTTNLIPTFDSENIYLTTEDIYIVSKFEENSSETINLLFYGSNLNNYVWDGTLKENDDNDVITDSQGTYIINPSEWKLVFRLKR